SPSSARLRWLPRKRVHEAARPSVSVQCRCSSRSSLAGVGAVRHWANVVLRSSHVRASSEDDGGDNGGGDEQAAADHGKLLIRGRDVDVLSNAQRTTLRRCRNGIFLSENACFLSRTALFLSPPLPL